MLFTLEKLITMLKLVALILCFKVLGKKKKVYNNVVGAVQSTIGELASISEKEVVSRFFKSTMQKLLKVTQEAGKSENSRSSNSRQIDHASNESSPSLLRCSFFSFFLLYVATCLVPRGSFLVSYVSFSVTKSQIFFLFFTSNDKCWGFAILAL